MHTCINTLAVDQTQPICNFRDTKRQNKGEKEEEQQTKQKNNTYRRGYEQVHSTYEDKHAYLLPVEYV